MDIYSGSKRRIVASGILAAPPKVGGGALMSPYIKAIYSNINHHNTYSYS